MADIFLDTTFFIDLHRGDRAATQLWDSIRTGRLSGAFSTITAFELWFGRHVERSEEMFYEGLFFFLEEAALTVPAAIQAALWLRSFPDRVSERLIRDALIAAVATLRNEAIYTRNVRDFTRFHPNVRSY